MRYAPTPPAEIAQIRADILDLLARGECDTRTIAEWIGMTRQRAVHHMLALVTAGRVAFRIVPVARPWGGYVWRLT